MRKDLKDELHKLYTDSPSPNPSNIQDTIIRVRKIVSENQLNGLTFWEFYFQQFGFIRKKVWLIQFSVLLFCSLKLYYYPKSIDVLSLILSIIPLIFLSGITELSRTYTYGTIELELSTKYKLNQIMISRISILGLMNILSITILGILLRSTTTLHLYSIFVYIFVPFMMTCFGCLWILNRFKNKKCNYYCFAFGIFIMVSMSISKTFLPKLYIASSLYIWSIMLVIAIIGASIQIYKLINNCTKNYDFI